MNGALRVLREPADRDAVVHDVFVDLISSRELRESYRGGQMAAWLGAIARHHALDFARRESSWTDLSAAGEVTAKADPLHELRRELVRFASTLTPERRRMVELRYVEGMTQMEAAAILGKPRTTIEDWEHQFKEAFQIFVADKKPATRGSWRRGGRRTMPVSVGEPWVPRPRTRERRAPVKVRCVA